MRIKLLLSAPSSAETGLLPPGIERERNNYRFTVGVSYEIDLWGKLRAGSQASRADLLATEAARERELLAAYRGAIQNAFRDVRAALVTQSRARESYEVESARAVALQASLRLARLRYANGLSSQLEVLDAERNLLAAVNARHEALRAQRVAVAELYKALGG